MSVPEASIAVLVHKGREERTIEVPRCPICRAIHGARSLGGGVGCGVVALLGIAMAAAGGLGGAAGVFAALALVAVGWYLGAFLGQRWGELKRKVSGVEMKPAGGKKQYPPLSELLRSGWREGPAEKKRPAREMPPVECPVCSANLGSGLSFLLHQRHSVPQRCEICGQWGCRLCMHWHEGDTVHWRGHWGETKEGAMVAYANAPWRHNKCCSCGFAEGMPMG